MPDPADLRDITLVLHGDRERFTRLVQRHQGAVARWLWRFTRDRDDHADLVQEAFVAAFSSLSGYRGRGDFALWLRKIAVRTGYAYWRRRDGSRSETVDDIGQLLDRSMQSDGPEGAVVAAETVHRLLAQLAPRDRLVLTMLYLEQCSVAQAAEVLGWSQSMVKVQA